MAGNKNQHFVPRCYLRPFTDNGNGKAINLYNIDRNQTIPKAPVKGQCSGDYFYGDDLKLEHRLQSFEGEYATLIASICKDGYRLIDEDRRTLKRFWLLQHLRTESASLRLAEMFADLESDIGEIPPDYRLSVKNAVQLAMNVFFELGDTIDDLNACLIRNTTTEPFITSDNPAVVTNRWHLTDARAKGISPGLRSAGTIGILPISPDILLLLYDGGLYTVPHKHGWATANRADVDALNEHQAINCNANLYFHDWTREAEVREAASRWIERRPTVRHLIHHMVFDRYEDGAQVYRVVSAAEAREQSAIVHSEALTPPPSHWPKILKWRGGGYVYDSGTGEGFVRRNHLDAAYKYEKIRIR